MLAGDFTIQLYSTNSKQERVYTLLTTYTNGHSNPGGTYDENLSIKNNSQYSFTFSLSKIIEGQINPLFSMIVENRRLRLTTIDYTIDFIITGITPNVTKNNVVYNVTCQDVFSYDWSKQNIKISYNSIEEYNKALPIDEHAVNILKKSKLDGRYKIDPTLENKEVADFPNMLTTTMIQYNERVLSSLEIADNTPFAAMVELANKYGAILDIKYPDTDRDLTIIGFKNQQLTSFKGLYIRPEVNLNNFSITRKTDNFCSILWVDGGEDSDGNIVSLMPTMPHSVEKFIIENEAKKSKWKEWTSETLSAEFAKSNDINLETSIFFSALQNIVKSGGNILYNFNYYKEAGLMTDDVLQELEKIFSIDMRNANLLTSAYSRQYNRLYSEWLLLETEVEDYIASIAAEEEYQKELLGENTSADKLTGQVLVNYNNSLGTVNDISFDSEKTIVETDNDSSDAKYTSLNTLWLKTAKGDKCTYVENGESLYGKYFIYNKIVELIKKKEAAETEYKDYYQKAQKIENKYKKEDGTVDWQVTNSSEEKQYSSKNHNSDYIDYCYYMSLANNLNTYVGPINDTITQIQINKRGFYQVFIDELIKLGNYYEVETDIETNEGGDPISKTDDAPTLISNLLKQSQQDRDNIWKKLYSEYGDYICESSYSDSTQLSNDALYLTAQKEFASRCNPSVDYSATVIDLHKILNVSNSKIEIGDIIYFYNKDLYNEYNGNLILEISDLKTINNIKIGEIFSPNKSFGKTSDSAGNSYAGDYIVTIDLIPGATYTLSADIKSNIGDKTPNPRISIQGWYAIKGEDEATEDDFISSQVSTPDKGDGIYYHYSTSITTDPSKPLKKVQGWVLDRSKITEGYSPNREYRNAKITLSQNYDISSVVHKNGISSIYVKVRDLLKADELLNSPLEVWVDGLPVTVINKYLDMKPKPIQLQITGITKKLRDATTQLTVSNNRTVENLLGKILRRTK